MHGLVSYGSDTDDEASPVRRQPILPATGPAAAPPAGPSTSASATVAATRTPPAPTPAPAPAPVAAAIAAASAVPQKRPGSPAVLVRPRSSPASKPAGPPASTASRPESPAVASPRAADAEGPAPSTDPGTGVGSDDRLRHELVRQALVRQGYIDAAHLDLRTPEQLAEHQAAHGRQPTQAMQERIERFTALRSRGVFLNDRLVGTHSFRNPSIMSKLIEFLELDEAGTNLEPSVYDPRAFPKQAFYRELAKAQEEKPIGVAQPFPTNVAAAIEMAKERAKRFTHSIEESQALAAGSGGPDSAADAGTAGRKRKPRWDQ